MPLPRLPKLPNIGRDRDEGYEYNRAISRLSAVVRELRERGDSDGRIVTYLSQTITMINNGTV